MKNKYLFIFFIFSFNAFAGDLSPFTTDGCSMFPDGSLIDDSKWVKCCIQHDLAYWKGGTKDDRKIADNALKICVEDAGEKSISNLMHLGVKFGGDPVYPTWFRWGYGWPYARGYKALTKDEKLQVKDRLFELRDLIDETIKQTK